jgi:hypothetical protein BACCOPRO_01133
MKNYLYVSAVGAMLLAACSNDDTVPLSGEDVVQPGSAITLTVNSGGDGLNTRAGRPVNSSEAANNVTVVRLYIYNPSGTDVTNAALAAGTQNPVLWTAGPSDSATPGDNPNPAHKASQTVKLNKLATNGVYTVVAYGYNTALDYNITAGTSADDSFTAALPAATNESELFAGKATFNVINGNIQAGTSSEVELRRHVAGLLGYFKNVPVLYPNPVGGLPTPVAFVRVYASSHATSFTFPSVLNVNGTGNNTKTKVLEFGLNTLITDYAGQITAAGTNLTKVFNIPAISTGTTATVPNSILNGKFLVPFAQVAGATTFTVQLEDALGTVLKTWDVVNNALTGDKKIYDVRRNYFYSLGQKVKASSTDGGTPDPGTTDDNDNPIDLSQETVITVTVNDAWDTIYNLGIE